MSEEKNQLRLSLEIKALKQHEFTAQLYFVVRPISALNMKNYKSSPTQAITNARAEIQINNCFKSYLFEANRSELRTLFSQQLYVELWHNDRIKKDILLGIARLPLSQILQQPFRKSKEAYVLTYDAWLPVDEVDGSDKPLKKIGTLRTISYLQDLGPVSLLKQKGFDIKNFIDEEEIPIADPKDEYQFNRNVLPSEKYGSGMDDQKRLELNQLEHQVVWELETWKKAEQARTRLVLKQKEAQFWTGLSEQQKKSDIEKEKQFKKIEANLLLIENKLKAKMNELIKREQKIVVMEQELQTKIGEISREVFLKDQEIERMKRKHKQEKTAAIKQKSAIELELAKFRAQNAKLRVELEEALKQDDKAPINILKNELSHKISEIKALRKQLQNCMETKEEFKQSYQKMKRQVIERGALLAEKSDQLSGSNQQIQLLKRDIKHLEQKLVMMKQQQFHANNYGYGASNDQEQAPIEFSNERDKLIYRRREMLEGGNYTLNDPLIKEIDKRLAALH